MKNFIFQTAAVAMIVATSCSKDSFPLSGEVLDQSSVGHDMIVLGDKLENPYAVNNVKAALNALYPTKADRVDLSATDLYVRFLPTTQEQYERLLSMGIQLMDHPVDYEIVKEGDYYHDPSIPEGEFTWQYAVLDKDFVLPKDITWELLDECFLSENMGGTRPSAVGEVGGIDWAAVERASYEMTGNGNLIDDGAMTKGGKASPSGRVCIIDDKANGGKPFGVAGVKVVVNTFVRFGSAYTDRDGYYSISKGFSSSVRYRIMFQNEKGFKIGLNLVLVPASFSTFGKGPAEGLNATIDSSSNRKLFTRCVVNNAAYEYFERCAAEDMNINLPVSGLRLWLFQMLDESSAVMLHHGTVISNKYVKAFLGNYGSLAKYFLPDITIGTKGMDDYASIYAATVHELAHASHYSKVGNNYWDKYIYFILKSFASGGNTYGSASDSDAGYCEVGEMWAYYVETMMYYERYGGNLKSFGTSWWFYPQILRYLEERGISRSQIFAALDSKVTSRGDLQCRLDSLYPSNKSMIDRVFRRYGE